MGTTEAAWINFRIRAEATSEDYSPLVEAEAGRFLVPQTATVTVDITGHRTLERVEMDLVLNGRYYNERRIEVVVPPGGAFDFHEVRIPVRAKWCQAGIAHLARLVLADGQTFDAQSRVKAPDPLLQVALCYSTAAAVGAPPVQYVAEEFSISAGAAAQRVKRARDKGYLPPTTPGVAS